MIDLSNFKSKKSTEFQCLGKFLGKKKRPDADKHPGENGDEINSSPVFPSYSTPLVPQHLAEPERIPEP